MALSDMICRKTGITMGALAKVVCMFYICAHG